MIYDWDTDSDRIVRRLNDQATFKICTKSLNESELIEGWILHHAGIVGIKNLIIADNYSDDPETLRVYNRYGNDLTIFKFNGHPDEVHGHSRFLPLFDAIRKSAIFYAVFDTDERLIFLDQNHWEADSFLLERLINIGIEHVIPTTWLINMFGSRDQFHFRNSRRNDKFISNLNWGKPIMPGQFAGTHGGIHNIQFRQFPFSKHSGLNFFLLHLTQLPERRMRVNKDKLMKRGVANPEMSFEQIAALNKATIKDNELERYISEIQFILETKKKPSCISIDPSEFIELNSDGTLTYSTEGARAILENFLRNSESIIKDSFC